MLEPSSALQVSTTTLPFTLDVRTSGATQSLVLRGAYGPDAAPVLREAIALAVIDECTNVVVDLAGLSGIDPLCVRVLVDGHRLCRARRMRLLVMPGDQDVQAVVALHANDAALAFLPGAHP